MGARGCRRQGIDRGVRSAFELLGFALGLLLVSLASGCSGEKAPSQTGKIGSALTATQVAVLGFENPTSDWTASSGSISASSTVTQGSQALALTTNGWTEVVSVPLSSLGATSDTLSLDISIPQTTNWGDIRVVLVAPSAQIWWSEIGVRTLVGLPAGEYSTLTFPLSGELQTQLAGDYDDLRIRIIINGPGSSSAYLLDNIVLTGSGEPNDPEDPLTTFEVVIPSTHSRSSMILSASEYLQIDDRVEVGTAGALTNVASLGPSGLEVGSAVQGHTNVIATGDVLFARSQALIEGYARAAGEIVRQDASVQILGGEQPGSLVTPRILSWEVEFPEDVATLPDPINEALVVDPGAYGVFNVHNSGVVTLRTGTYYFDSFNTEPDGRIELDNAAGPVVIYVKGAFVYKGAFMGAEQEGQLLVGLRGETSAFLQAPFVGTMVAPNGTIDLHRPTSDQHRGAFFGRVIHVFSDCHIVPLELDWTGIADGPRDTDGDKTPDDGETCLLDPNKTEPGICGCGTPDTDSDGDLVPDCLDRCPADAAKSFPGNCGCSDRGNLQPAGDACIVEACGLNREQAACDGAGSCGTPSCAPQPSGCFFRVIRDRLYWFCPGPVTFEQAEAACNTVPDRSLVAIDDRVENAWISSVMQDGAWLGGNALETPDQWFWSANGNRSARSFWVDGEPVNHRFNQWSLTAPSAAGDCLAMQGSGLWTDADCTESRPFVCEQPLLHLVPWDDVENDGACDFYPGLDCPAPEQQDDLEGDCVDGGAVDEDIEFFPVLDEDQGATEADAAIAAARVAECNANCPSEPQNQAEQDLCDQYCTGFASVAGVGESCNSFSSVERVFCNLASTTGEPCSKADPYCSSGYCGRITQCAVLGSNGQPLACADAGCTTGVCIDRGGQQICIDPAKSSKCDDRDASGENCIGICYRSFACGEPEEKCAANDDDEFIGRCEHTLLCPEPQPEVEADPREVDDSNLEPEEVVADAILPTPDPKPPIEYPTAESELGSCGGDGEPACSFGIGNHPWCKYDVDQSEKFGRSDVSDADDFGDKQGTTERAGPLSFDFDPNLSLFYEIPKDLLPLGDAEFKIGADASASAGVGFNLFKVSGHVNILDAYAVLVAERCGITADARLALFGIDFLPVLMDTEDYEILQQARTLDDDSDECEALLDEYVAEVGRGVKAMRDAQELIRQQQEAVAAGNRLAPDFCEQVLGDGVPAHFPSEAHPFVSCDGVTPEQTINYFIEYYQGELERLAVAQATMLRDSLPEGPSLSIPFLENVNSQVDESRRETQQIANMNFAIGPIPMNLTIEAFAQYGIAGELTASLTPGDLVNVYNGSDATLASVDATVTPFAGAGVSLFLGVGFDWGALSAKVGIAGDITLANVLVPLYSGAGIGVRAVEDDTAMAPDLTDKVASATNMQFPSGPPKQYEFFGTYKFGASVEIRDILQGTISAKLRIKFLFFSKSWSKVIARFDSPLDPIVIPLIHGGGSAPFGSDGGVLGRVRMPLQFVQLAYLDDPGPLPPLPDPGAGTAGAAGSLPATGGTSTGGTTPVGGTGTGAAGGIGDDDPRYVDLDPGRVEKLFYSGYCACSAAGAECTSDLDCCGGTNSCVFNDLTGVGTCEPCVETTPWTASGGEHCTEDEQCCDFGAGVTCSPRSPGGPEYCQACYGQDETVPDADGDDVIDFGECCTEDMSLWRGPIQGVDYAAPPVCSGCRQAGMSCNNHYECCQNGDYLFCYEPQPYMVGPVQIQPTPTCSGKRPNNDYCQGDYQCQSDNCSNNLCQPEIIVF